jgi:hypothetical protein
VGKDQEPVPLTSSSMRNDPGAMAAPGSLLRLTPFAHFQKLNAMAPRTD